MTLIGNGWTVYHETPRTIELRKDTYEYRRLTGKYGFVFKRGEPGMPHDLLKDEAIKSAIALDEELTRRVLLELIPTPQALETYAVKVKQYVPVMNTGEEPALIGRKKS